MDNCTSILAQCPGESSLPISGSDLRSEARHACLKGRNTKPTGTGLRVLLAEGDTDNTECTGLFLPTW